MILYQYRCPEHARFDVPLPMGGAPSHRSCPQCGAQAVRQWSTVPVVTSARASRTAVLDHCERSRSAPDVVDRLPRRGPGGRGAPHQPGPGTRRLPRP